MQNIGIRSALLILLFFPFINSQADHIAANISSGALTGVAGGGVNTESGVPLGQGDVVVGFRFDFQKFEKRSDAKTTALAEADEEADLHTTESIFSPSLNLAVGVTDDFTVGFKVPWIFRENVSDAHDGQPVKLGDVEGIGDTVFFGQYRLFHREETEPDDSLLLGATDTHVSTLFGIKAPTGRENRTSDYFTVVEESGETETKSERFEAELQPGSGSWDPFVGFAGTQVFGPVSWNTSAVYTFVTEGSQKTNLGDIISYNSSLSYRLDGSLFDSSRVGSSVGFFEGASLDLILEINGEFRDKVEIDGTDNDNSGGNLVFISPGLRLSGGGFSASVSGGFPISTDLNGDQVDPDYSISGVLSYLF